MLEPKLVPIVSATPALLSKCAELYCQIWLEPPWSEDFWQPEKVLEEMQQQLALPEASGLLATSSDETVVGFTWGYRVSLEELGRLSGGCSFSQLLGGKIFYIDELGVANSWRHHGLGHLLTRGLLSEVGKQGFNSVILRTDISALAARRLYQEIGFRELAVIDKNYPQRSYWQLSI